GQGQVHNGVQGRDVEHGHARDHGEHRADERQATGRDKHVHLQRRDRGLREVGEGDGLEGLDVFSVDVRAWLEPGTHIYREDIEAFETVTFAHFSKASISSLEMYVLVPTRCLPFIRAMFAMIPRVAVFDVTPLYPVVHLPLS